MYNTHEMLETLSESASTELAKGTEHVNTKEMGEVVDMIKDLTEAEKNRAEACYYNTLVEAMEESEYGEDYDEYGPLERKGYPRSRDSRGRFTSRSSRRNYPMRDEMWHDDRYDEYMQGRMNYSNGAYGGGSRGMSSSGMKNMVSGSRYGYSYDNYMRNRSNYSTTDPEDKKERMKMMEEYTKDLVTSFSDVLEDATPEEKNALKMKLAKVVNSMQ